MKMRSMIDLLLPVQNNTTSVRVDLQDFSLLFSVLWKKNQQCWPMLFVIEEESIVYFVN